jgi:hypothetical protein
MELQRFFRNVWLQCSELVGERRKYVLHEGSPLQGDWEERKRSSILAKADPMGNADMNRLAIVTFLTQIEIR